MNYEHDYAAWKRSLPDAGHDVWHAKALAHGEWRDKNKQQQEKGVIQSAPSGADDSWCIQVLWTLRIIAVAIILLILILLAKPTHAQFSHINSIQFDQAGSPISGAFFTYPFVINCTGGLTCTVSGATLSMSATGGGTGCNTPGTVGAILYDTGTGCGDLPDFTFNGTHTYTFGASAIITLDSGVTFNGLTGAMLPNPSATTLGGVESIASATHKFLTSISTSGVPANAQPACTDLSDAAASCSTDATNASNILTGTLNVLRLPTAIPIANVGTAGLSGTTPIAISSAGAISCSTCNTSNASVSSVATSSPISGGTITSTGTISCPTCTVTVASGSSALGTAAISSGTCATVVTGTATGVATTDNIMADFNADPTSTTGYSPSSSGMLTIIKYPTANTVNFKVCNNTSSSITPGAVTLNWRVVR